MAQIIITIDKNGKADVEAVGYQGPSCILATNPYIVALGQQCGTKPKSEMFQENTQAQEIHQ